jgi:hypothetical protein
MGDFLPAYRVCTTAGVTSIDEPLHRIEPIPHAVNADSSIGVARVVSHGDLHAGVYRPFSNLVDFQAADNFLIE